LVFFMKTFDPVQSRDLFIQEMKNVI